MSLQLIVKFWILLGMIIFNSLGMMMVAGVNIIPALNLNNSALPVQAAQKGNDYKLPFRAGEVWQTDYDYGVHTDSRGLGFDFYATKNSTLDIFAPTGGKLIRGCSAGNATVLGLYTNSGDYLRFVHMDAGSVPISADQTRQVNQGDYLGKVTGAGVFETPTCKLSSDGAHLHLGWISEMCNFTIDGYTFDCSGVVPCPGVGVYNVNCNRKYLGQQFNSTLVVNSNYNNNYNDKINSKTAENAILTVQKGSTDNQTSVIVWEDKGMRSQKWEYNPQNGEMRGLAGKCLDAGNGNQDQDVRIEGCHGKDNQKWIYDSKNRLVNPIRNLCLDSYSGNANGSRLYMGSCHDKPNQKWNVPVRVNPMSLESINQPIKILGQDLALDVKGANYFNQNQVWLYSNNNGLAQKWEYNNATGQIRGLAGKCLDGGNGNVGQDLRIEECNNQTQQQWTLTKENDLKNRKNDLCVDSYSRFASTSRLYLNGCHGQSNQKWTIGNFNPNPEINQEIASKTDNSLVLDVRAVDPSNQTRVDLYARNNGINQKWKFNTVNGEIKGLTNKCLDAGNGEVGQDARINDCNGAITQKWELNSASQLVNKAKNLCLDSYSRNKIGSRLYVGTCHSQDNQKWTLINT
jgi:Ricin-type beta-trefoil lectin domain